MKILFTHRYFWPDSPPYGAMLRSLAGAMAGRGHAVSVFAGQPSYAPDAKRVASRETIDGIAIRRVATFAEDKSRPVIRAINVAIYCARLFVAVLRSDADIVTAASFPPVLAGWTASLAARLSGKAFVYHLQDIHPEVAKISGSRLGRGTIFRLLRALDDQTLRRAACVVVLSEDMKRTVLARPHAVDTAKIAVINNYEVASFADAAPGAALPLKRAGVFRAIFAGNLGGFQNLDLFVDAARLVADDLPQFELFLLGNGSSEAALRRRADGLANILFHDLMPYEQARHVIADADIGLVSLTPGVIGVSYPSKTFTYLGLGLPLGVLVEPDSALARMVADNALGDVAAARTAEAVADLFRRLASEGRNAPVRRAVAAYHAAHLTRGAAFDRWAAVFAETAPR